MRKSEAMPDDAHKSTREVDIQFDPNQGRFSIYFSPISRYLIENDQSKRTLEDLRNLLGIPAQKAKEESKSAIDKPHHIIFDIVTNGEIAIMSQNIVKQSQASGRNGEPSPQKDVEIKFEQRKPENARLDSLRAVTQALDILGDISLFVSWIEQWSDKRT
jgi:hypothetical protein